MSACCVGVTRYRERRDVSFQPVLIRLFCVGGGAWMAAGCDEADSMPLPAVYSCNAVSVLLGATKVPAKAPSLPSSSAKSTLVKPATSRGLPN